LDASYVVESEDISAEEAELAMASALVLTFAFPLEAVAVVELTMASEVEDVEE
jgi:hypothetical protein